MAITSQAELQVRARLASVARDQQVADQTAWTLPAAPRERRGRRLSFRPRRRLGFALIRLGALIAGPASPPLVTGAPSPRV